MNVLSPNQHQQLVSLTNYLLARREAILNAWRTVCSKDPIMHNGPALSREEFNDHMPVILNILEQQIRNEQPEADLCEQAAEHGLHRWHKGYDLPELLREIAHWGACVSTELTTYLGLCPNTEAVVIQRAYTIFHQLQSELVQSSTLRYDELQRTEAANRVYSLQQALDTVNQLEQQRSELLRMTSHDLRGGLSVIQGAAYQLDQPGSTDGERTEMLQMLQRNLDKIRGLLLQLTDLARLEAGQDPSVTQSFDVSELINSLVESARPLANERGLVLQADGPDQLFIDSDPIKIQRIVQNLLLNALIYTVKGFVSVSWTMEDSYRWIVSVQDTGPGLPDGPVSALVSGLYPTTELTEIFRDSRPDSSPDGTPKNVPMDGDDAGRKGEGLGLYIVKRLCELLNGSMDVESHPGQGTLFRIRLPIHPK